MSNAQVAAELARLAGASNSAAGIRPPRRAGAGTVPGAVRSDLPGRDPLEQAYRLLLARLGIGEEDAPIVERGPDRLVFHSRNFCPTLEACRILDLDTRRVCRLYNEGATGELLRQVDPRLVFRRNYEKLRPYAAYCEEIIELEARPGCSSQPRNAP
jgi:hypothetical protein